MACPVVKLEGSCKPRQQMKKEYLSLCPPLSHSRLVLHNMHLTVLQKTETQTFAHKGGGTTKTSLLPPPACKSLWFNMRFMLNTWFNTSRSSAPHLRAAWGTEQITAARISTFREDPFLACSCRPREEPTLYRHF